MIDRFTIYGLVFASLAMLPGFAWLRLQVSEYRVVERRLDCESNYYLLRDVARYGASHPCAEFVDEYRFIEKAGLGWHPEYYQLCREFARDPRRVRDLVCSNPYLPPGEVVVAPPVSYFANRGRRADDLFQDPVTWSYLWLPLMMAQ